jgi:hypothetical protein
MAFIGAIIMGGIVAYINYDHGILLASIAGLKQATYTFFFGGVLIKILETIALKINNQALALLTSVIVTSIITITLVYLVHQLKGTPRPLESTMPTVLMAPPGFLVLAYRKRKSVKAVRS